MLARAPSMSYLAYTSPSRAKTMIWMVSIKAVRKWWKGEISLYRMSCLNKPSVLWIRRQPCFYRRRSHFVAITDFLCFSADVSAASPASKITELRKLDIDYSQYLLRLMIRIHGLAAWSTFDIVVSAFDANPWLFRAWIPPFSLSLTKTVRQ